MIKQALRRAARSWKIFLVSALLLCVGAVWPTAVQKANHLTAGAIANTDTITITYNVSVMSGASSVAVCAFSSGVILIGDTGCGSAGDTPTIGKITGLTVGANASFPSSSVSVATNAVTITMGGGAGTATVSGKGTFAASGTTVSTGGTDVFHPCTLASCTVVPSGNF